MGLFGKNKGSGATLETVESPHIEAQELQENVDNFLFSVKGVLAVS